MEKYSKTSKNIMKSISAIHPAFMKNMENSPVKCAPYFNM